MPLFCTSPDQLFSCTGFQDWKHALGKKGTMAYHDRNCIKHKHAVLVWNQYRQNVDNVTTISAQLNNERMKIITQNRQYVKGLMECLLYCAQQGIGIRGHRESNMDDISVNVSNFRSLVLLRSRHDELFKERLATGPRNASWIGHDMLLSIMANFVSDKITAEVKAAKYFTLIVDEARVSKCHWCYATPTIVLSMSDFYRIRMLRSSMLQPLPDIFFLH